MRGRTLSNSFIIGKDLVDITEVDYLFNTPLSQYDYYFSILNENYSENIYKKYLYNCLLEISKFINLKLEMFSEEYKVGSHVLYKQKIRPIVDASIVLQLVSYVKPVQLASTKYGDILVLKIKKDDIKKIWQDYNNFSLPIYKINIKQKIIKNYPSWFLSPPDLDGYLFGVGYYNSSSTMQKNFKNADYMARLDILKTLKLNVKSELYQFIENDFELFTFFNEQSTSAHLGGIYIIKRYFDKKTNLAFSLAVLRLKNDE